MFFAQGNYVLSQVEQTSEVISCPRCTSGLEPKHTSVFSGFVCSSASCTFAAAAEKIYNLTPSLEKNLQDVVASSLDIEDMKSVVDDLVVIGRTDLAGELSSLIVESTKSETVLTAEEVEGLRLLSFVQAEASQSADPVMHKVAARLAMIRSEITKGRY